MFSSHTLSSLRDVVIGWFWVMAWADVFDSRWCARYVLCWCWVGMMMCRRGWWWPGAQGNVLCWCRVGMMMCRRGWWWPGAQGNVLKMGLLSTFSRRWTFAYCNNWVWMLRLTICVFKGTLLKHIEEHTLQGDMKASDILFYYTSVSDNWVISGEAGLPIVLLIYQPTHFILYLLWTIMILPHFVSMEIVAVLDFVALAKVYVTLKPLLQMPWNVAHTHRRHIGEETYTRVFSFVE